MKKLLKELKLNIYFLIGGYFYYLLTEYTSFIYVYTYSIVKNIFLLYFFHTHSKKHKPLNNKTKDKNIFTYLTNYNNIYDLLISGLLDICILYFCYQYKQNILIDILLFIPFSFVFELIFDFFHYWTHRIQHNPYLYSYHKKHHLITDDVDVFSTYQQHPLDLVISNIIPMIFTSYLFPLSEVQLHIFLLYKTFIEISGHGGTNCNASSFTQLIRLPKLLGIELYGHDHYLHHTKKIYNYSKRFTLWDKVFGTYLSFPLKN